MPQTIIPFALTSAFATVFVYSAVHEFARRRREGPLANPRDAFDFDESAPNYQRPEDEANPADARTDETAAAPNDADDAQGAENTPDTPVAEDAPTRRDT